MALIAVKTVPIVIREELFEENVRKVCFIKITVVTFIGERIDLLAPTLRSQVRFPVAVPWIFSTHRLSSAIGDVQLEHHTVLEADEKDSALQRTLNVDMLEDKVDY